MVSNDYMELFRNYVSYVKKNKNKNKNKNHGPLWKDEG